MIKWSRNAVYFRNLAARTDTKIINREKYTSVIRDFAKQYNCTLDADFLFVCTEEDFLIIKLTEPGAIYDVHDS